MSFLITHTGNSIDVQAIIVVQPLNGLPGLAAWTSTKRTTAPAVFLCATHSYTLQWWAGWGSRKVRRVPLLTGPASLIQLTTNQGLAALGGDSKNNKGVQP